MKIKLHNYLRILPVLVLLILFSANAFSQPASCTAVIGTPANGLQHHITISWSAVNGATSYRLDYSTDNVTWINALDSGTATTYDHDASNQGNVPIYYRVSSFVNTTQSAYTDATPYPIYTACDFPSTPTVTNAGTTSVTVQLVPESPTPNATGTTYAIYCTTTSQYVQANGTLGASPVWQTMATWGTVTVTGLSTGVSYCFYVEAMNENGDIRVSTSTIFTQTFDAASSLKINEVGATNSWWSPSSPTSGVPFSWSSTGGCSGGTGGGNITYSGSFTNYFGDFIRSPATNCAGNSSVVMTFDLSNSYIASHIGNTPSLSDAMRFYMYADNNYENASSVKINGVEVSSVDGNGTWLEFTSARSCVLVSVTFDLSTITNLSNILFYLEADDPYNDSYNYSVNIDNVSLLGSAPTACATTSTCSATTISNSTTSETVCAGSNTTFSVTTAGGPAGSYQWQVSTNSGGSWSNVSNSAVYSNATTATLTITDATSGMNGYEYRCQVTGSCSGTPTSTAAILNVNLVPTAAGAITGTATVCQGQNIVNYSINTVSGATSYTWSLPSGATIVGSSNTANITVDYSGSASSGNIDVTPSNTCGSGTAATPFAVTVNQTPALTGSITGNASPCGNTSQTYSVSAASGATSYTWTLPNGWTGSSTTNSITVTTGSVGGTISVMATNTCGNSATLTLAVTVANVPATPGAISGPSSPCAGTSNNYSVTAVGGSNSYTWTLPNGWTGSSTSDAISATAGSTGGTISITANNTCGSSTAQTLAVTPVSVPVTPGPISGPSSPCAGTTNEYTVSPVPGSTTYTWTLPNGWSGSSTGDAISITAGSANGNISVTANNTCGNSPAQTLVVTPVSVPATPGTITGPSSICSGASNEYSVAAVPGSSTYTWTLPGGWSGSSTADAISATAGSAGGNISVTANNTCGNSPAKTLLVTITSIPATPAAINGANPACIGSTSEYSVASVAGATSYTWILPNGWGGSSTTDSISAGVGSTSGTISVTANNTCGNSTAQTLTLNTGTAPSTPGIVTGSDSVCNGTSQTYSIVAVNGATSYSWTLPNGWTGTSSSDVLVTTAGSASGAISVTANNSCGSSSAQTLIVTANSVPATSSSVLTGPTLICNGGTGIYSVTPVAGTNYYSWSIPNGWTGSSVTDSIAITTNSASGTVSVTANNTCGASTAKVVNVTVGAIPQPLLTATDSVICSNDSTSICTTTPFTSYLWNTQQTTACITVNEAGNYYVTVTDNNGCTAQSPHLPIGVHPVPSVSIVVNGDTLNTYGEVSYQWLYDGHFIPGATSPVFIADSTGSYSIQVTDTNHCSSISTPVSVIANGIANIQEARVEVYPNPLSSGNWQLVVGSNLVGSVVTIYNVNGQLVYRSQIREAKSEIPLQISSGMYFINILYDNKIVYTKKLVKVE